MKDFHVHKFYYYNGPSLYLNTQAVVFNLVLAPEGPKVDFYEEAILKEFPQLEGKIPGSVVDLFAKVVVLVNKMDMDLYIGNYNISEDGEEWVIAVDFLDEKITKNVIYLTSDWFSAITAGDTSFNFRAEFESIQQAFDNTSYGGPTLYSLIEAGVKRDIPVTFLYEENQFQWGYGKKQIRGRSTTFHIDGIKDTEFTMFKDMCGDFLEMCGFPTPKGVNCFEEDEIAEEANKIGYPCVVKPVSGHKGQGVTTNIENEEGVRKAFRDIIASKEEGKAFDGALVQKQIFGYDHRILTVGGKYTACLKRIPAFVVGDGKKSIKELIEIENDKEVRLDNARSPLCKILIDDTMHDWLYQMGLTVDSIPKQGEEIVLRRVANISAGGVSINVTDDIHPENIRMVENIANFLNVTCLGIDVLAADITKPWQDGNFGIIEINAGPGVFMHLAPAEGGSVDVPGKIMEHLFGKVQGFGRIPIIAGNKISYGLSEKIYNKLTEYKKDLVMGSLLEEGVFFNHKLLVNHPDHEQNCKIVLRNPKLDFAIFNHNADQIHDFGTWHKGSNLVILDRAGYAETALERDLLPGGLLVDIVDNTDEEGNVLNTQMSVFKGKQEIQKINVQQEDDIDDLVFRAIEPHLKELLFKYDYYLKLDNSPENIPL